MSTPTNDLSVLSRDMFTFDPAVLAEFTRAPLPVRPMRHGCRYLANLYDTDRLMADASYHLASIDFDTFVGTGLSGTIAAPLLAHALNKSFLIVRKLGDTIHSAHSVEGHLGKRWVFVDDIVSTGETRERCKSAVAIADPDTIYVGSYLYGTDDMPGEVPCFYPADGEGK